MNLLIDNYDSFTWNLAQMIGAVDPELKVVRNDSLTPSEIEALHPAHLIFSPGPGRPEEAGYMLEIIKAFAGKIPILGICLGHQAICLACGGSIRPAAKLVHGQADQIFIDRSSRNVLLDPLPDSFAAARYHSLAADDLPACLEISARSADGEIMAVAHKSLPVFGLQFHPESILSEHGETIIRTFLSL